MAVEGLSLHFDDLYDSTRGEFSFAHSVDRTPSEWAGEFRAALRNRLGLDEIASSSGSHAPLETAHRIASEDMGEYVREMWQFMPEPNIRVPYYFLYPKARSQPLPLVVTPHGHNPPHFYVGIANGEEERERLRAQGNDVALQAVLRGYAVIAPTARGFGETRLEKDIASGTLSSCRELSLRNLLIGRTLAGERVWDILRLVDWAERQPVIDSSRIAITGNSGGAAAAILAAACDERISVAAVTSYFCTFRGSIGSLSHCACNYVPSVLQLGEMYDIAGLIAPRPFRAVAGVEDHIFPIKHVRLAYDRLRTIYAAFDARDQCDLYEAAGGHRYYEEATWPFIAEHL